MRTFIAIDLPDDARDAISDLQADVPVGKLSAPENLHLTLAFLNEQPAEVVENVHHALLSLSRPPFDMRLAGVETFGGNDPKVLVANVQANTALDALHRKIRSILHGAGIMLDRQRFRPHVTLARFPHRPTATEMERLRAWLLAHSDFAVPAFSVTEVVLFRSTLMRSGAVHDELARYPLR